MAPVAGPSVIPFAGPSVAPIITINITTSAPPQIEQSQTSASAAAATANVSSTAAAIQTSASAAAGGGSVGGGGGDYIEPTAKVSTPAAAESRPSGGFKGYGKGNFGVPVPAPCPLDPATERPEYPFARQATEEEIAQWMKTFKKLQPPGSRTIKVGQEVLWRGFKKDSTKEEYFHGEVHKIIQDKRHGTKYVVN